MFFILTAPEILVFLEAPGISVPYDRSPKSSELRYSSICVCIWDLFPGQKDHHQAIQFIKLRIQSPLIIL